MPLMSLHDTWSPVSPIHNRRGQQIQITLSANQPHFTSLSYNKILQYFGGFGFFVFFLSQPTYLSQGKKK